MGVAKDPWGNDPRLRVVQFNTFEVGGAAPPGPQLRPIADTSSQLLQVAPPEVIIGDPTGGIVRLGKGDFAVFQLQFRVGDDDTISKDWQALDALESITMVWEKTTTHPAFTAPSLPIPQGPPVLDSAGASGRLLRAPFDHAAVHAYFADFIEDGQDAFVRSHFEASSAVLLTDINDLMFTMADRLLKRIAEEGSTDVLLERLRACGRNDIVAKILQ